MKHLNFSFQLFLMVVFLAIFRVEGQQVQIKPDTIPNGVFYVNGEKITPSDYVKSLNKTTGFGNSLFCNINVACDRADPYGQAIEAVFWMNGTSSWFVQNTSEDRRLLFISAAHVITGGVGTLINVDVKFYYQTGSCENPSQEPDGIFGTLPAIILSRNASTDYTLCEFTDPGLLKFRIGFLGWDLRWSTINNSSQWGVIGHPQGDIKKIAFPTIDESFSTFISMDVYNGDGAIEVGYSGAPLVNKTTLRAFGLISSGIIRDCDQPVQSEVNARTVSYAWNDLKPFLDPINSGVQFLDGAIGVFPVELTSFAANVNGKKIILNWETATEVNNYGFEIERSTEKNKWVNLGFVEGHGNSNSPKNYSFEDESPSSGLNSYRLKQIDNDGAYEYSEAVEVSFEVNSFTLEQNYPNPFNPSTKIRFSLAKEGFVELVVYNVLGEEVKVLISENKLAGSYFVVLNATDFSSGIYFYKLRAGDFLQTKKMVLLQ